MNQVLVTVVIPVYKVEKYLDRCVESVVNQTHQNLEILLVDDGSPDRCPQMCDEWAKKDSRIKVIHKQNGGLSSARNAGIDYAQGKYICFLDSDDYLARETVELASDLSEKESADIAIFGMASVNSEGKVYLSYTPTLPKTVYSGNEIRDVLCAEMLGPNPQTGVLSGLPPSACCALYSMELINRADWRLVSEREIISEDIYSLVVLYAYVRKAVILPSTLYHYCENGVSISRSYRPDRHEQNKYFYNECIKLCRQLGYSDAVTERCAEPFLRNLIAAMKQEVAHHDRRTAIAHLRTMIDDELVQRILQKKRKDKTNLKKRVLYAAMRHRQCRACYILLKAKNAAAEK